jgi:hypothetical protein
MDPVTSLAATAVAVLAPYLAMAGGEFAKETGKAAVTKIGPLYKALKARFEHKPAAQEALVDLEANPMDADAQTALTLQLKKQIKADTELAQTVRKLLDEIDQDRETTSFLTQVYGGEVGQIINARRIGTIKHIKEPKPK